MYLDCALYIDRGKRRFQGEVCAIGMPTRGRCARKMQTMRYRKKTTLEMTKPGSGETDFRALRPVPDRAVFRGSRRVWSLPLEARDCSRKCLSEDNAQMPSTKKPGCGKCLLFLSFGEHLRLAGRFTITVQAKGYQLFLHFISA